MLVDHAGHSMALDEGLTYRLAPAARMCDIDRHSQAPAFNPTGDTI
jgi:hypothetical protein